MATIELGLEGAVATLTVRNERHRNALSWKMLGDLDAALDEIERRPEVRVVRLEAEGDRSFSSGGDIKDWSTRSPDLMGREWIREGNRIFSRLARLDAVVICLIEGDALGGGLELALAADIRIAAPDVQFGFPELGIGAIPGWLGCTRLEALVGQGRARQMILTGLPIDAATAERWGVVNEIVPREQLRARADELAQAVLSRSPTALSVAKRLLNLTLDVERLAPAYELAATVCRASADAEEGLAAFAEKRQPRYG